VEGLGFAIPSTTVQDIVSQLIAQGYVSGRPTLGITGESLSLFYQHYYRLPAGLYITAVEPGSSAYAKGVEAGDILISLDGKPVSTMDQLNSYVYAHEVGDTLEAVVYRGGQQYKLELLVTEDKG
jgi:serine protease Do